ncbi:MAG: peptidase M18 [Acidobacteriota bacterium]
MKRKFSQILALGLSLLFTAQILFAQDGSVWASKKNGWLLLTETQRKEVFEFAEKYKNYLRVSRTAYTSAKDVMRQAKAAGFMEFTDAAQVKPGARLIFHSHDRAVILAVVGTEPISNGSRVVATHHDSPHLDLKGRPIISAAGGTYALFKTVPYGGIKKYQWANLPLALVGRIDTTDGRTIEISIGLKPEDPVFVLPDSAPHSDTELRNRTYTNVFAGEEMNPVVGSMPGASSSVLGETLRQLMTTYNFKEEDFVSAELALVPATQPMDVGIDRGLIGAYGQDDRLSSYCAARAVMDLKGTPPFTAMAYLSNFEEVGSSNNSGAASQFLNNTYAQLIAAERGTMYSDLDLRKALTKAFVVSADTNDGVNPIFPNTSEASNAARLGFGATIKLYRGGFNANSEFTAKIRAILDKNAIPWQTQTPKVDVGGGGTIGSFMSNQNMQVIDMGVPLLSMHATYEMSSKVDVWNFYRFMSAFYQQ